MSLLTSPHQPPPPPPASTSPSPSAVPNGPQSPKQHKEPLSHRLNEFMASKPKMHCFRSLKRGVSCLVDLRVCGAVARCNGGVPWSRLKQQVKTNRELGVPSGKQAGISQIIWAWGVQPFQTSSVYSLWVITLPWGHPLERNSNCISDSLAQYEYKLSKQFVDIKSSLNTLPIDFTDEKNIEDILNSNSKNPLSLASTAVILVAPLFPLYSLSSASLFLCV